MKTEVDVSIEAPWSEIGSNDEEPSHETSNSFLPLTYFRVLLIPLYTDSDNVELLESATLVSKKDVNANHACRIFRAKTLTS